MIKGLHHSAYRCRDTEETRAFYEGFLGLPFVEALWIEETKTARTTNALHSFFQMDDGSCLAFFEVPHEPFEFKDQHDYDLHIALTVEKPVLDTMLAKDKSLGIESRGIADHGFADSIYFRDPNGYVVELCTPKSGSGSFDAAKAKDTLAGWQASKAR